MPGDVFTSRNENVPSARRIRSSAAPAAAADDVERGERLRADRRPRAPAAGRSGRSTSSRRRSTCCGSRSCPAAPRCGSAAARGRSTIDAVSSMPATNSSTSTSGSCCAAASYASRSSPWSTPVTLVMPIVEPSRAGFTISGRPSSATTCCQSLPRVDDAIARRRNAAREPDELRAPLVHRERGGHDAAAGVRNAERLERALHRAVLAEAAVQRDEHAREAVARQLEQVALGRIERMRVDAALAQRVQHGVAGQQRDLALGRRAAEQHGDLAEIVRRFRAALAVARCVMALRRASRTSGSSTTPVFACTTARTCRSAPRCRPRARGASD